MAINERNFNTIEYYRKESKFRRQYNEGLQTLLDRYGLSLLEGEILFALYTDASCDTVTKLCADLGKTKGVVSLACDRLARQKCISGRTDRRDRRVVHFHLLSASQKIIDAVSDYMEIMNDVQKAKAEAELAKEKGLIMSAELDTENGLIFPIVCNICDSCRFPNAPFRAYDSFIIEQFLPNIAQEQRDEVKQQINLAAVNDGTDTEQTIRMKIPYVHNKALTRVVLAIEPSQYRTNTARFTIRMDDAAL